MKSYSSDLPNVDKLKGKFRIAYTLIIVNVVLTGFLVVDKIYERYPEVIAAISQTKAATVEMLENTINTKE